jgi:hypothetical protein
MAFTFIRAFRYSKRIHLCSNSLETAQIVLNITPSTTAQSHQYQLKSVHLFKSPPYFDWFLRHCHRRAEQYPRVAFACWLGLRLLIRSCKRAPSVANWSRDTDSNSRR